MLLKYLAGKGNFPRGRGELPETAVDHGSGNTAHQPVIAALKLIGRHAHDADTSYWPLGEHIPVHSGILGNWRSWYTGTTGTPAGG